MAGDQKGGIPSRQFRLANQGRRQPFAESLVARRGGIDRGVHFGGGLLHHPEGSVGQPRGDVLAGRTADREFPVVDRGGAVHRDVSNDAAPDPLSEQRTQPDLDHVSPEKEDDAPAAPGGFDDRSDDRPEIAGGEEVGQAVEETAEAPVGARRPGQEGLLHPVQPGAAENGSEQREIGFAVAHWVLAVASASRNAVSRRVIVP